MIKKVITDFKRVNLYGDAHLTEDGYFFPLVGKGLYVKLFGLFFIRYKSIELNLD